MLQSICDCGRAYGESEVGRNQNSRWRRRGFVSPVAQGWAGYGCGQGQAQGDVEDWRGENQKCGGEQRDKSCQLRVMQDVVEDQKQESGRDDGKGAIQSVHQTKLMAKGEAGDTQKK